jgi:hypothetical protein
VFASKGAISLSVSIYLVMATSNKKWEVAEEVQDF